MQGGVRRRQMIARIFALLSLVGVLAGGTPAAARTAPGLSVSVTARSIRPGELVLLTITAAAAVPSAVRVSVFERTIQAFPVDEGRWRALVGIDLDQRPGRYVASVEAEIGGTIERESLSLVVRPRSFAVRTLRVNPDFVDPSPAMLERIRREAAFIHEIYVGSADRLWSEPFVRPVPHAANGRFGARSVFNGKRRRPHAGTDFSSPAGTPVHAPNAGRIVCARELFFTGNTVIVDHGLGVFSMLAHLAKTEVAEGERVAVGQRVGLVGATGRVTGPHLHWALTALGARVDPLSVLALLGR